MTLELIKIKARNLTSNGFEEYYINKSDIVALQRVSEDYNGKGCEYILTIRDFRDVSLLKEDNHQLFRAVEVASTNKSKINPP